MMQMVNANDKNKNSFLLRDQRTTGLCRFCGPSTFPIVRIQYLDEAHETDQVITNSIHICHDCINAIALFKSKCQEE